jgi:hypothetical protein
MLLSKKAFGELLLTSQLTILGSELTVTTVKVLELLDDSLGLMQSNQYATKIGSSPRG